MSDPTFDPDSDEAKIARMTARSQLMAGENKSSLEDDPSLPPDAQTLRRSGALTPLEIGLQFVADESLPASLRLSALGKVLPYMHRLPATKTEITVDEKQRVSDFTQYHLEEIRKGNMTVEESDAILDRMAQGSKH